MANEIGISVVTSMYNTEKYIGVFLESLLAQTFKNFEVIVVNNGSTDNGVEVVKNYIPRFEGRLKLLNIEKNLGGPYPAMEKGGCLSRGKYIFFMDSDDLILNRTLEILYNEAENFNADVVYMDRGFIFETNPQNVFPKKEDLELMTWNGTSELVERPTWEVYDIGERIKRFCKFGIGWPHWQKLIRRDFLIDNEIIFPNLPSSGDIIFTLELFCLAEKFLTIPWHGYLYRQNPTSVTHIERPPREKIDFWMTISMRGLDFLEKFLSKQEFFKKNPFYVWKLLNFFEGVHCQLIINELPKVPPEEMYQILKDKFKIFGEYGNLIAYLCTSSNIYRSEIVRQIRK